MTRTLSDFLHEYAEKYRTRAGQVQAEREEWVRSVERLMARFREWLEQADTEKVLRVEPERYEVREEALGSYTAPGLTITLGARRVQIRPMGRGVVGRIGDGGNTGPRAQGRVDITDGAGYRYVLYRALDEGGERWVVIDPEDYRARPLDRATFESALLRLLG